MDRVSLFRLSGLPDAFGAVLLILGLILLLSPYFSGADFGIFKIPVISLSAKTWLKVIGPIAFVLCVLSFLPVLPIDPKSSALDNDARNTPTPTPTIAPTVTPIPTSKPTPIPVNARLAAQKLGAEWFAATDQGDVESLIQMADPPFFFAGRLLLRPEDIRESYEKALPKDRPQGGNLQLRSMTVETIASMEGMVLIKRDETINAQLLERHRLAIRHLDLTDGDLVLILHVEGGNREIAILYPRKVGGGIKLAGWLMR